MTEIKLFDARVPIPDTSPRPENWYVEPFSKRKSCGVPGQCGGDCDCGCPYNTMTEVDRLPLIDDIARIFPNEWLAFIISPSEDEEYEPVHGKLIAHSPDPDEIYDAVNTVLWNQHVYVYFNGSFDAMKTSYGSTWDQALEPAPQPSAGPGLSSFERPSLAGDPRDLVYTALDQLYGVPRINEAICILRLARVKAASQMDSSFIFALDAALDKLEAPIPLVEEIIWDLEEALAELETV